MNSVDAASIQQEVPQLEALTTSEKKATKGCSGKQLRYFLLVFTFIVINAILVTLSMPFNIFRLPDQRTNDQLYEVIKVIIL